MRRAGHLLDRIAEPENLRRAFYRAAGSKRARRDLHDFAASLHEQVACIRQALLSGAYRPDPYTQLVVHDPKTRAIHAPSFRDRVVHHAIVAVCGPHLERRAIADTFACRIGRGQFAALDRTRAFTSRYEWFLKADVRKYFDSIDHRVLRAKLARIFKDRSLLDLLDVVIDSYQSRPECGLPIGCLTSQCFANLYLDAFDRLVKERWRAPGYVRYMDDMVVWGESRTVLRCWLVEMRTFLSDSLHLDVKPWPYINRTRHGRDFLGFRVHQHRLTLSHRSRRRFAARLGTYQRDLDRGAISELGYQRRVTALVGGATHADSLAFRRSVIARLGALTEGLEPLQPRRQLEQRCQELPFRLSQQQRPGQPQQQPGRPPCPSSPAGPEVPG